MLRSMSLRGRSLWRSRQRRSILNRIATRSATPRNDKKNCHPELRERAEALSENHAFRGAVFRESSKTVSESDRRYR